MKPLESFQYLVGGDRVIDPDGKAWQVVDNSQGSITICRVLRFSVVPDGWKIGDSYVECDKEVRRLKERIAELESANQ